MAPGRSRAWGGAQESSSGMSREVERGRSRWLRFEAWLCSMKKEGRKEGSRVQGELQLLSNNIGISSISFFQGLGTRTLINSHSPVA
jgi:hypothetical protein